MEELCKFLEDEAEKEREKDEYFSYDLYSLPYKISQFEQKTEDSEKRELARQCLELLTLVNRAYLSFEKEGIGVPDELMNLIYDYRDNEFFRNYILDEVIEEEGEECLENRECIENSMSDYFDLNLFDAIFFDICGEGSDLLSIDERINMLWEYFSDYL